MTSIQPAEPATLIVGMITGVPPMLDRAEDELSTRYGPVEVRSPILDFDFTDYYEPDMGKDLKRRFVSFEKTIDPGTLAEVKLQTDSLEETLARQDKTVARPINLDPGTIGTTRLVLASTKDAPHRVYVGRGIFAEVTLVYRDGRFVPLDWTYPDYRTQAYLDFFTEVRKRHLARLTGHD